LNNNQNLEKRIEIPGFAMYDQWLHNYRDNKKIDTFFKDNSYNSIAIYGMGRISEHIIEDLKGSDISIKYGIDKNAEKIYFNEIEVILPERISDMDKVDAIVVTPIQFFNEIEKMIKDYGFTGEVLSIRQVVDYTYLF